MVRDTVLICTESAREEHYASPGLSRITRDKSSERSPVDTDDLKAHQAFVQEFVDQALNACNDSYRAGGRLEARLPIPEPLPRNLWLKHFIKAVEHQSNAAVFLQGYVAEVVKSATGTQVHFKLRER